MTIFAQLQKEAHCASCKKVFGLRSIIYECDCCDRLFHWPCYRILHENNVTQCPVCQSTAPFLRRTYNGFPFCKWCNRDIKIDDLVRRCDLERCDRITHAKCWENKNACPICGWVCKSPVQRFLGGALFGKE